jgi:hypothetical protein
MTPVSEHSVKPEEVRNRIERLFGGPYLELYARKPFPGWVTWGNEIARETFHEQETGFGDEPVELPTWPVMPDEERERYKRLFGFDPVADMAVAGRWAENPEPSDDDNLEPGLDSADAT